MDWDAWARKAEAAIDVASRGDWKGLFAPGARFADPANAPTADLRRIARDTRSVFPDWRQEITSIRGGDDWAVFEWIGRASYRGLPVEMHGATIVEVDGDGLVTSWRDYLDRKEPEEQLKAAARAQRGVVERYLDGIVAHDWDAVTACLRPDVERVGPFGDVYTPRDVYVRFLADLVPTLAGYRMDVSRVRYAGRVAIAELSETVELDGEPVLTPEALVFELDDEGLIRHIAIYVQHLPRG